MQITTWHEGGAAYLIDTKPGGTHYTKESNATVISQFGMMNII